MRGVATVAVVLAVVLAGCGAPAAVPHSPDGGASTAGTADPSTSTPAVSPSATPAGEPDESGRSDPDVDVQGWEQGVWADESLNLTPGDGHTAAELSALVARAMARVERVRDVEFERPVEVTVRTRDELDSGGGGSGDGAAVQRATYRALFLVGDGGDAGQASNETRQATVQGYYSVRRDEIVVVSPTETPQVDELTLGHELVHAYQFRHREIRLPESPSADAITAVRALVEGEANFVERRYERRCRDNWSCAAPAATGGSGGAPAGNASVHMGLYLLSFFPYAAGEQLVRETYREDGWDAVEGLFANPPPSTAAVIHRHRDRPESVAVPDRSATGWQRGGESTVVGEDGLATMFMYTAYDDRRGAVVAREAFLNVENGSVDPSNPLNYGLNYTTGWTGDALAVYEADGEAGYVWRLRWADASEAREFARGYRQLLGYRGGDQVGADGAATYWRLSGLFGGGYYVAVDGRTVTVVHAPSVDALGAVWGPAGRNSTRQSTLPLAG